MAKDVISQSIGLDPIEFEDKQEIIEPSKNDNDYEYARRNLYDVIEKGNRALEDIIDIAQQSESARAFEVATNLIKTMVDANKDLLSLAKTKKELDKSDIPQENKTVNNNLFVGSSAELLKMIKDKSNE